MTETLPILTPTNETYSGLEAAFDHFSKELFGGSAPPCLITLQRQKRTCGYFSFARFFDPVRNIRVDEIALNPHYFASSPITEVLQTVVHEMVHQWQAHFGTPSRACYHNREWADKMKSVGLMPSHTGYPGGKQTGQQMNDYPIDDGPFLASVERLLATGFTVHWLDIEGFKDLNEGHPSEALGAQAASALHGELTSQTPRPSKEKMTYEHICTMGTKPQRLKVWGKPGLSLACGECGELYRANERKRGPSGSEQAA